MSPKVFRPDEITDNDDVVTAFVVVVGEVMSIHRLLHCCSESSRHHSYCDPPGCPPLVNHHQNEETRTSLIVVMAEKSRHWLECGNNIHSIINPKIESEDSS